VSRREQNQPKIKLIFNLFLFFFKKKIKRAAAGIRCALGLGCPLGQQKRTKKKNKANQKKGRSSARHARIPLCV
jgi:hypothetical protein